MATNTLHSLSAFVRAVEAGSFTGAAKLLDTTPSAVSKSVSRLERRLGVKLFLRSTRSFMLTGEGQIYYENVAPLLRGLDEADSTIAFRAQAIGKLRISMPNDIGRMLLTSVTSRLVQQHPGLSLDINLSDRYVDIIREGFDVALRLGHISDSELYARRLTDLPLVLVASPDYLTQNNEPKTLADLELHRHVRYRTGAKVLPIRLADGSHIPVTGTFDADSGEAMRIAAINGLGIAQILMSTVQDDIHQGRLKRVMANVSLMPVPVQVVHGFGRTVPIKVKVFIDFIAKELELLASALSAGDKAPAENSYTTGSAGKSNR
ncbi:LysR family transcriptional regulator [Trabulsiella odontotermitis]|uniref:LysR family transcriptional regulator n=1 Tax=Trabulsiella odontotermitis TaxID=379893 RepID=UPI003ACBF4E5